MDDSERKDTYSALSRTGFLAVCVCGKVCTSKPGLTLHQRKCKEAADAKAKGLPMNKDVDIIQPEAEYHPEVQELFEMVKTMSIDADRALREGNKSAGRRARIALTAIKKKVTPLRDQILKKMKESKSDKPEPPKEEPPAAEA